MIQWTGKNLKEVLEFTGKSDRFDEWFPTFADFESHVKKEGDTFKIIKPKGSETAFVGDWIYKNNYGINCVTNRKIAPIIFVTRQMALCNQFNTKGFDSWPDLHPEFDISELNTQAARLLNESKDIFAFIDGEESEVAEITKALGLTELNNFLNEVFDGYLHEKIAR